MVRFALESVHGDDGWLPAVRMGDPWNGHATPVVTPATMATFARQVSDAAERWAWAADAFDVFTRDGDVWVMSREGEDDVTRIEPDADGNYDLSMLGYTFADVTPMHCSTCDRPASDDVCPCQSDDGARFTVIYASAGCLPDGDDTPPTFTTARDAWDYVADEVESIGDDGDYLAAHTALHVTDRDHVGSIPAGESTLYSWTVSAL